MSKSVKTGVFLALMIVGAWLSSSDEPIFKKKEKDKKGGRE